MCDEPDHSCPICYVTDPDERRETQRQAELAAVRARRKAWKLKRRARGMRACFWGGLATKRQQRIAFLRLTPFGRSMTRWLERYLGAMVPHRIPADAVYTETERQERLLD